MCWIKTTISTTFSTPPNQNRMRDTNLEITIYYRHFIQLFYQIWSHFRPDCWILSSTFLRHGMQMCSVMFIYPQWQPLRWQWSTLRDSQQRRVSILEPQFNHYSGVIMNAMASQITDDAIVYPTVCSGADQRKSHVTGLCVANSPVTRMNSPHKGPVKRKMSPFDDVIMIHWYCLLQMSNAMSTWPKGEPHAAYKMHIKNNTVICHTVVDFINHAIQYVTSQRINIVWTSIHIPLFYVGVISHQFPCRFLLSVSHRCYNDMLSGNHIAYITALFRHFWQSASINNAR